MMNLGASSSLPHGLRTACLQPRNYQISTTHVMRQNTIHSRTAMCSAKPNGEQDAASGQDPELSSEDKKLMEDLKSTLQGGGNAAEAETEDAGNGPATVEEPSVSDLLQDALANTEDAAVQQMLTTASQGVLDMEADIAALREVAQTTELNLQNEKQRLQQVQDSYLRLSADFENFRKRNDQEIANAKHKAKEQVILDLVVLIDNFELAAQQVKPATEGEEKIVNSYQSLYKQLTGVFKNIGVEAVPAAGELFNPEVHEALTRLPRDDVMDQTVVEEYRKGFTLNGRLIRAAQVLVADNPDMPQPPRQATEEGEEESEQ